MSIELKILNEHFTLEFQFIIIIFMAAEMSQNNFYFVWNFPFIYFFLSFNWHLGIIFLINPDTASRMILIQRVVINFALRAIL